MLQEPQTQQRTLQVGWAVPASGPVRSRWEYLCVQTRVEEGSERVVVGDESTPRDLPIVELLASLGNADWELVSITPRGEGTFLYSFKRPVAGR